MLLDLPSKYSRLSFVLLCHGRLGPSPLLLCKQKSEHGAPLFKQGLHFSKSKNQSSSSDLKAYPPSNPQMLKPQSQMLSPWLSLIKPYRSPSCSSHAPHSCLRAFALAVPVTWCPLPPNLCMVCFFTSF